MDKEQGYIEKFSDEMLLKYGFTSNDRNIIKYLTDKAVSEKLYTETLDFQHNLKHVEKVIAYARMIMNKINSPLIDENILMYAALYHDIGKTLGASNKEHGLVGSEEFKRIMKDKLDDKKIDIISKLIFQHAIDEDVIDFSNTNYTKQEQEAIQLMSDILKDADALDRNRLNYPAPIGTCDINKLRTRAAKEILSSGLTDSLYEDYYKVILAEKQKDSPNEIMDNYELLNDWITQYDELLYYRDILERQYDNYVTKYGLSGISKKDEKGRKINIDELLDKMATNISKSNIQNDELSQWLNNYKVYVEKEHKNIFHASLNPSIDILIPNESTQKGSFVYGDIDPVNCFSMATFRSSTIFPRSKVNGIRGITEIFPNAINDNLSSKYITIYKLPSRQFKQYINPVTEAPSGEWVSEEKVKPIEQVTFKAIDLINYLTMRNKFFISKDYSQETQMLSFVNSFEMYIWNVKHLNTNPNIFNQKWNMMDKVIQYYAKDSQTILFNIKEDIDKNIKKYIEDFKSINEREPNYENEEECLVPLRKFFRQTYFKYDDKGKMVGLNNEYISQLTKSQEVETSKAKESIQEQPKSLQEPITVKRNDATQVSFSQRNKEEIEIASKIKQENIAIQKQNEQQNGLEKPKVRTLAKKPDNNKNSSSGFVDALIISLITGFVSGAIFMLVYNILIRS